MATPGQVGGEQLLEREKELALLVSHLEEARLGRGGIVLVEGAAGSGKTALLRELQAVAEGLGDLRVLRAAGAELEREFPYGVVRQLLERVVRAAPEPQRERLLTGAAALAAPVVGAGPNPAEAVADASFATLHGLYWLAATLAEDAPLVLLVDDAHWADAPSLRFLDFLARRAHELPLLLVVGTRVNDPGADHELLASLAAVPGAVLAQPEPLSRAGVRELFDDGTPDAVVDAALDATRGNPLLVRELVRALRASGVPPTAAAVNAAVPSSVTRSVERRLARVPADARRVAQALAVLGDRTDGDVLRDVTGLDEAALASALADLRAIELLEDDPPRFLHPLVRAATADPLTTIQRDRLHHRAATLLHERAGAEAQVVVHLLAARPLGELWVVPTLVGAARKAAAEGAPEAAVRQLRRALAELPEGGEGRPALELEIGRAAARAGDPTALEHLTAAARSPDPELAAHATMEIVAIGAFGPQEDLAPMADELRRALDRLGPDADAALRDRVASQLLNVRTQDTRLAAGRSDLLTELAPGAGSGVLSHLAYDGASREVPAAEVMALAERVFAGRPFTALATVEQPAEFWSVVALTAVDGADLAHAALVDAEATVRRHRTRLGGAFVSFMRSEWALAFGSSALAEAEARSALDLLGAAPANAVTTGARSSLVRALVRRGALDEAEAVVADFPADADLGTSWAGVLVWTARAVLREAQARPADVVADLEQLDAMLARFGWTRMTLGHQTARRARALAALGRRDEALALAEAELDSAQARGVASFEAQALIARAAAEGSGDAAIATLEEAVAVAQRAPSVRIRALAAYQLGAALRRAGRRTDARSLLADARDLASRVDAVALAAQATEELVVAGGRPRRVARDGVAGLTPSERRTAEHAARGLSNREIAETLFVTRKTVEFTLGNVYSKLGIRSRTQLPGALGVTPAD